MYRERKKNMKTKEMKGITLIALVVTIVVLLILTGVGINLVIGDNGIITMAQKAKSEYEEAKKREERDRLNRQKSLQTGFQRSWINRTKQRLWKESMIRNHRNN